MKKILFSVAIGVIFCAQPLLSIAEETRGVDRMGDGIEGAVTSPAKIPERIGDDARKNDPVTGTVTGTAKGSLEAAGQAAKGGADIGVGAVEAIVNPLTGK